MRRLLKYGFVLALAVAVGCYVVLGPPAPPSIYEELDHMLAERRASLEGWRAFLDAHQSGVYAQSARAEIARRLGAPAAAPGAAPTDNGRGYKLSERLASLASYAHSATAKVEQLLLADQAPASGNPPISAQAPADERGESQSAHPVSSAAEGAVPATAAVSHDASQDPNPANGAERSSAPGAVADGGDGGARTRLAALAPDEICQRDEARLAQLRSAPPSLDEATRFANELGCERLRPQILSMMESLAPASAAGGVSQKGPPEPPPREDAPRAWPAAGVVALKSDETCKRDEGRLARLRSTPSGEEAERFASELSCEALRPQLQRLMESLGLVAPAQQSEATSSTGFKGSLAQACASERDTLDRLRREPSARAAELFSRDLKCERLRPQVRLLIESLNVAADSIGSAAAPLAAEGHEAVSSDTRSPNRPDPLACRRETAELDRIRATLDLSEARSFASAATCEALKPQVARLLESLGE